VDFLGLVLLLHASRRRQAGRRAADVAFELGVHEHTLRRLVKRLVGDVRCTPEEEGKRVTARLDAFIRTHLLREDADADPFGDAAALMDGSILDSDEPEGEEALQLAAA
jgi:hypothetical protein